MKKKIEILVDGQAYRVGYNTDDFSAFSEEETRKIIERSIHEAKNEPGTNIEDMKKKFK